MARSFVIAEAGSSHDCDINKARELIFAAKECGADAVKFQMCGDPLVMAERRGMPEAEGTYRKYLSPVVPWLPTLKGICDDAGIEFMCTTYLELDIEIVAPYVKRFKVSAYEADDYRFINAHRQYRRKIIVSHREGQPLFEIPNIHYIYCVNEYPCALEHLHLRESRHCCIGLSDHTTSTLTGALAVACGKWPDMIIEKHIRLSTTNTDNPDYKHSLVADDAEGEGYDFYTYVKNIRLAEEAMGD